MHDGVKERNTDLAVKRKQQEQSGHHDNSKATEFEDRILLDSGNATSIHFQC